MYKYTQNSYELTVSQAHVMGFVFKVLFLNVLGKKNWE